MGDKRCWDCKQSKPTGEFHKDKSSKDGLAGRCKECIKQYQSNSDVRARKNEKRKHRYATEQEYRKAILDSCAIHRKAPGHSQRHADYLRNRYNDDVEYREKLKEYQRSEDIAKKNAQRRRKRYHLDVDWRKKILSRQVARHAAKVSSESTLTETEWGCILNKYNHSCAYCGRHQNKVGTLEREHVIPSSRGGQYSKDNIIPACRRCNASKGSRTPKEAGMKIVGN